MNVLIVEDQRDIAQNIADYLSDSDWQLDFAYDGLHGLDLALANYYDVIVLDLMLPGLDGIKVCEQIRAKSDRHIPIIMLTARDTLDDKVEGFESGADDYLTKPFSIKELQYRCLALSKRHKVATDHKLQIGTLTINRQTHEVTRDETAIVLNQIPFDILLHLAESYPRVVSRSELIQKIWGDDSTDSDSLRSHIYQLRQQIDKPFERPLLKTVHGVGFVLDAGESS